MRSRDMAVIGALLLTAAPVFAATPTSIRQDALRYMVRQDCGSCHGMTLKGGLGSPLLPQALDSIPAEHLTEIILNGIPGTPMPPWAGLLSADEAGWIANELKKGLAP